MTRILIAEDEPIIAGALQDDLTLLILKRG